MDRFVGGDVVVTPFFFTRLICAVRQTRPSQMFKMPRSAPVLLVFVLACGPSWTPPQGEEVVTGSTKVEPAELCAELALYEDQVALAEAVIFPHDLPDISAFPENHPRGYESTVREMFGPRGFYYLSDQSAPGLIGIGKRLTDRVNLHLSLDVGSWSVSSSAILFVSIGDRYSAFRLPPSLRAAERLQYPMIDIKRWRMLLENYAASIELIEQQVVQCAGY